MLDDLMDSKSVEHTDWLTNDKDAIKKDSEQYADKDSTDSKLLFDAIDKIGYTKEPIEFTEDMGWYNSFFINNAFSQYIDTVLYAYEMNMRPDIDNEMHYHYMVNSIRKCKRRGKWAKLEDDLENIMLVYIFAKMQEISRDKAQEYVNRMPTSFMSEFKKKNKAIALADAEMVLKRFTKKDINKVKDTIKNKW